MIWPPPREPLEGSIVRLEALQPGHEAALAEAAAHDEIWIWMDRTVTSEPGAFGRWFAERLEASRAGREWCFATLSRTSGAAIGSLVLPGDPGGA